MLVAVVLAAGAGRRYVGPTHKLLAPFAGTTVVEAAVDSARRAAIGSVVVVSGAVELPEFDGATVVHNPRWADGQATSVSVALAAAAERNADALVIGLGDQPLVGPDAWRAVAGHPGGPIVAASFEGRRSPPVRLDRSVWPLVPRSGDEGARLVMRSRPDLVTDVAVEGQSADIDTLEDLHRWS